MRRRFFRQVAVVLVCASASGASVRAQPKGRAQGSEVGDKGMDKQMAWENKVMGDDSAKRADMKRIAAAQKVSDEARKHPAPEPVAKVKDPSKEGVRAKQEASIGLPIASDEEAAAHRSKSMARSGSAKKPAPSSSANDELGALVASSLAADKAAAPAEPVAKARAVKAKGKPSKAPSNSLDDMFSKHGD